MAGAIARLWFQRNAGSSRGVRIRSSGVSAKTCRSKRVGVPVAVG
jgi:hypothetical protein